MDLYGELQLPHPQCAASAGIISLQYATGLGNGYQLSARVSDTYTGYSTDEAYYFGVHLPAYAIAAARLGIYRHPAKLQLLKERPR